MEETNTDAQSEAVKPISNEPQENFSTDEISSNGVTEVKSDDVDNSLSEPESKVVESMETLESDGDDGEIKVIPDEEESYTEISEDGWEDILGSGRLKKRIIKEGKKGLASEGLGRPSRNDNVTVSLKGYFQDELFEDIQELQFVSAEAEVIQAIDLCVVLMNTGEVAEIMADPEMAYGSLGLSPTVPPNAAVRLEVELLSHSAPIPPNEIPIEERCAIGNRKRTRGNFWFLRNEFTSAIQCYRKAGEFLDDEKIELDAPIDRYQLPQNLQDLLEDRLKAYNNLAQAQMKIKAWDSALASLKQVLRHEPNNEKALYRKSRVLLEKYRTEEAIGILRRICRLYPENATAKADLARVSAKQKKSRQNEEKMSKKMLGLDKYEAEKAREKWYTKYLNSGLFSTTNAAISISAVIFAAVGTVAYYTQSNA